MNIDALVGTSNTNQKGSLAAEQVDRGRSKKDDAPEELSNVDAPQKVQSAELINTIKTVTENGTYAVQFENNDNNDLIIKVIDRDTNEIIRQIPPEELQNLTKLMNELTGNIVNTVS